MFAYVGGCDVTGMLATLYDPGDINDIWKGVVELCKILLMRTCSIRTMNNIFEFQYILLRVD